MADAGNKRKRGAGVKFYAVRIGKIPGIYHTWTECLDQVRGFPKAMFKSFVSLTEAEAYVAHKPEALSTHTASGKTGMASKYYAVQSGRVPGVYTEWSDVLEQITGWKAPRHKAFKTRGEAEQFVSERGTYGEAIEGVEIAPPAKKSRLSAAAKKAKLAEDEDVAESVEYEPGEAPLPSDTSDGFDPTIILDPKSGKLRRKTSDEMGQTKWQATSPTKDVPIKIYTDGSALGNGQAGATAGVGVYFGPLDSRNLSESLPGTAQTNNRAELSAILRALELAPRDRSIVIYSDSNYAISCVTSWFQKWRSNGWLTSNKKPVENRDLVQQILALLEDRHKLPQGTPDDSESGWNRGNRGVKFVWVKGHDKDQGNIAADGLAVSAAKEARELELEND